MDPARYSAEDNLIIFLGIADYIGDIRGAQDRKGNMICTWADDAYLALSDRLPSPFQTLIEMGKPTSPTLNSGGCPTLSATESTRTQTWSVVSRHRTCPRNLLTMCVY